MSKSVTIVEIDVDRCSLEYGIGSCPAVLGVDSEIKCYNSLGTCPATVRANFDNEPVTYRFAMPCDYLPAEFEAIPNISDVAYSPAILSLGKDLGQRASLTVTFKDHLWADTAPEYDPYKDERGWDSYQRGTYWGKFRARNPFVQGRAIRLKRGFADQALTDFETRHFIIESFDGPKPDGTYRIVAKDALKQADADRAQAPVVSNGFLIAGIDDNDMAFTLTPSDVGDDEYPTSGYLAIGGKEIVAFTRVADAVTITARAQFNTLAVSHSAGDRAQLCLVYTAIDPAEIIADLLENYADVNPDVIPLGSWLSETGSFLQSVYTACIPEPTAVSTLINELIEQAALVLWWDDVSRLIRLQVLRNISTEAALFDQSNVTPKSLQTQEQPATRLSQVWTYFALRNPLEPLDNDDNYRSTAATRDLDAEANYLKPAIKKIRSRWIPFGGRSAALRVNDIQLARFRTPPRKFTFEVFRDGVNVTPALGGGYRLSGWGFQDATGADSPAAIQITRLLPDRASFKLEAEEVLFSGIDPVDISDRTVIVDVNQNNLNLRTLHDALYPAITDYDVANGVTLTCIIETGIIVGSVSVALQSFDVGLWPVGFVPHIVVRGRIQGRGGNGGFGAAFLGSGTNGDPGGPALYARHPITLDYADGEIWGGGGGGGGGGYIGGIFAGPGSGGGGGAGTNPGGGGTSPNFAGLPGTSETGGLGPDTGGDGGGPGLPGQNGGPNNPGSGGAAGAAIDGDSFVTITSPAGDLRGPQIN